MSIEPMVHIVDDDDAVRKALGLLFLSEDIPSQGYVSAEDFLSHHAQEKLGCLLLDIRMPGMSGLELLDELKKQKVNLPIIFITGHGDISMAVQAMKSGAVDFIEKPFDNERLLNRVRECICNCLSLSVDQKRDAEISEKLERLTKREREVMAFMADGKQNKMIARDLNISTRTVEIHRAKVMSKLQAKSLSDVVRFTILAEDMRRP